MADSTTKKAALGTILDKNDKQIYPRSVSQNIYHGNTQLNTILDGMVKKVYLSLSAYNALKEANQIDENTEYNVYEE